MPIINPSYNGKQATLKVAQSNFMEESFMVKSVETITELIGNTPLVKLNRLVSDDSADVCM